MYAPGHAYTNSRHRPRPHGAVSHHHICDAQRRAPEARELDVVHSRPRTTEGFMKQLALALALIAGSILGVAADATVTGTWTMNVEGGPHGNATMGLVLKQEGTKVTGTFSSGHSADMEVAGQFKDGPRDAEKKAGRSLVS